MTKLGLIQTISYSTNQNGISKVSEMLKKLGKKETDIVCLPEQWLKNNKIANFDLEFLEFKKIAKDFSMTIIPGAFYEIKKKKTAMVNLNIQKTKTWIRQKSKSICRISSS
jgi:exonuclease III